VTTWLHAQRIEAVARAVLDSGATSVADLGCGDGDLLIRLAGNAQIARLAGVDLCAAALGRLRARLAASGTSQARSPAVIHDSIEAAAPHLVGFECAALVETIEHIDPARLSALEHAIFEVMRPRTVFVTTPNNEFNPLLGVPAHRFRHPGHRFEWSRREFRRWADGVAARRGYVCACRNIVGQHPRLGGASQMARFDLLSA